MIELPRLQELAEGLLQEDFRTDLVRANIRAQELHSFLSNNGIAAMLSEGDDLSEAAVQITANTKWPTVINVGLDGRFQVVQTVEGGMYKFSKEMRSVFEVLKVLDALLIK